MFDSIVSELVNIGAVVAVAVLIFATVLYLADRHASKGLRVQAREPAGPAWRVVGHAYDWERDGE